jgi:hypothetical protein
MHTSRVRAAAVGSRNSARLAAKESGMFMDATANATKLKTLQNSLAQCSIAVQTLVAKKKIVKKTKKPVSAADLSKLSSAISLGAAASQALDRVVALGEETAAKLDAVLINSA